MERTELTATTAAAPDRVTELMNKLRGRTIDFSAIPDYVADSFNGTGRIAGACTAAASNFTDSFTLERERQLRRRAERLIALANSGVSIDCIAG
jgi:hypothetical protein